VHWTWTKTNGARVLERFSLGNASPPYRYNNNIYLFAYLLIAGVLDEDEDLPVKDIDDAVKSELDKIYSAQLHITGTGETVPDEQPKSIHTELWSSSSLVRCKVWLVMFSLFF